MQTTPQVLHLAASAVGRVPEAGIVSDDGSLQTTTKSRRQHYTDDECDGGCDFKLHNGDANRSRQHRTV
jgi:hypothetical protein